MFQPNGYREENLQKHSKASDLYTFTHENKQTLKKYYFFC